jgi:mRNA interferase RelE/StbE
MGKYRIEIKRSAVKEIKKLPSKDIPKILAQIESLSENPRPGDSIKLSQEEKYRVRCGQYRILYAVEDQVLIVYIVRVGHREDVYRTR